jgi:hypothetical protein
VSNETVDVYHQYGKVSKHILPLQGEAILLRYYRKHLPSGDVFCQDAYFVNRAVFESCLKLWNGTDTWFYSETEEEANMAQPGELVACGIARHMWNNLPDDRLTMIKLQHKQEGQLLFTLWARRCGRLVDGKPVLTGGAEVCVWSGKEENEKLIRLKPGWDEAQFKAAVIRAYHWAMAQHG